MADIEKITANGTTYDIADASARADIEDLKNDVSELNTNINNKVSKSGDTMTGDLIISESDDTQDTYVRVAHENLECQLQISGAGNRGIWDRTAGAWTIRRALDTNLTTVGDSSTTTNVIGSTVQINGTAISSLLSTQSVNADNISITADTYTSGTFSCSRSGYTALGILGFSVANASSSGVNSSRCYLQRLTMTDSTTVGYTICNRNSSDAAKVMITVIVLYVKN